ncbi:MAG: alpha/beta fold hydrolase [Gammaproteobacteria bacterium]
MTKSPAVDGAVLVHGGTCAADIWDELMPLLPFPAVAVDMPGRGSHPADLSRVTLDDCVSAVLAAADAAGFRRFALVGHSLGGVTITEAAYRHPERVRSVIYLGALVPTPEVSAARLVTGADMPPGVMPRMPEAHSRALFGNDLDDAQWAGVAARLVDDTAAIINATVSGLPLACHRVYIGLTQDIPVPPALVEAMVGVLGPDLERITLDTGHMIMNSQPQLLATTLARLVRTR